STARRGASEGSRPATRPPHAPTARGRSARRTRLSTRHCALAGAALPLVAGDRENAGPKALLWIEDERCRLPPRAHAEPRECRREVALDRAFGDEELVRDLRVRKA